MALGARWNQEVAVGDASDHDFFSARSLGENQTDAGTVFLYRSGDLGVMQLEYDLRAGRNLFDSARLQSRLVHSRSIARKERHISLIPGPVSSFALSAVRQRAPVVINRRIHFRSTQKPVFVTNRLFVHLFARFLALLPGRLRIRLDVI